MQLVLSWGASGCGFEVFAEEGRVREVEFVADLLHCVVFRYQHYFGFQYYVFFYDVARFFAEHFGHDSGEVFR